MTCTCCQVTPCCTGDTCSELTRSQCVHGGGSVEAGSCAVGACIDPQGKNACTQSNQCGCLNRPGGAYFHYPGFTCNCTELSMACRWYYCEQCVGGSCVNGCPSPRTCCAGTCCPLPQTCVNGACVDKCGAGTTFCAGNGTAFNCCGDNTKCCGASGCLSTTTTTFLNYPVLISEPGGWNQSPGSVPAGATVTITARQGTAEQSPDGTAFSACKVIDVNAFRLIGKVGDTVFDIGSSYTGKPGSGVLALRPNLTSGSCTNNQVGSYEVDIAWTTDPCPGFTPAAIGEPIVYGVGEEPPKLLPGPGAALKDILKLGGIVASPTCPCNARAAQMDEWGSGECIRRCREIVGWLKEESAKRDLWFFSPLGYALVFAAVALAALKRFWKSNNQ